MIMRTALLIGTLALAACASGGPPAGGPPEPEAAAALASATAPTARLEVIFDWSVRDREARFSGQGLLRLDRDRRARVDLYGPRGETLAAAILDERGLRVVPAAAAPLLPPEAFLWSALGVFRQPPLPLTATSRSDGALVLGYSRDGERWEFRAVDDRLRRTEWTNGAGRRTVEVEPGAAFGLPRTAHFRDWTEFRELNLTLNSVEEKAGFDADTWTLPGER